jgi:hypothetical protein
MNGEMNLVGFIFDEVLAYIQKRNVPSWEIIRSWMPANTENGIEIAKTIHDKLKKGKK